MVLSAMPLPVTLYRALRYVRNSVIRAELSVLPSGPGRWYLHDGLWTKHAQPFLDRPDFRRAYRRAVRAAGWDYQIEWRFHTILWAATRCSALEGAFVECGTGRGFMASGICEYLGWTDRPFYLYDTFTPGDPPNPVYATDPKAVADNFAQWPGVRPVVGSVPGTLSDVGPVVFLHVDMNHPDPEEAVVRHFWPHLVPGAVIIYDDYGFPAYGESLARADRVAADLGFSILALPTGQGLVIKG